MSIATIENNSRLIIVDTKQNIIQRPFVSQLNRHQSLIKFVSHRRWMIVKINHYWRVEIVNYRYQPPRRRLFFKIHSTDVICETAAAIGSILSNDF